MLFLVPTPIGNLKDITLRSLEVLKEVDLILSEDTRTSGVLLKQYDITVPQKSYHQHNEHQMTPRVIEWLQAGQKIALISDAGTPGISDPGFLLVRACHEAELEVTALPGPTAIIPALVVSGLPCDKFYFEGFLPHKKGRKTRLEFLAGLPCTFSLYESPHRVHKCLVQLGEHCGTERKAAVIREISKIHEEVKTGSLEHLISEYHEKKVKGEIVIVVAGR
ncbi:MAG: 16S rRNA (cytidine(1402)-2'-O)-methyltransferase [Saprospiraceae bacterium]|nr:16S rRNA (cytidine(1402)-2'-O)-methyltransferase [Saprospiraceae bacterium]